MASVVKISITEDVARALEQVKHRYPTMSDSELFRLGLAELSFKAEMEQRQAWLDSLPTLELSNIEQDELTKALKASEQDAGKLMTPEEIVAEALSD